MNNNMNNFPNTGNNFPNGGNNFPNNGNQQNGMNNNFNGNQQSGMNNNFNGNNFPNNGNQQNGMNNNFNENNFPNNVNQQNGMNNNFNGNNFANNNNEQNGMNNNNQMNTNYNNMNNAPQTPMNNQPKKGGLGVVKYIVIGIAVLVGILVLVKVLGGGSSVGLGGGKNTTGISGYSGSDVTYNCVSETKKSDSTVTEYIDLVFNYKSGSTVYQLKQYGKIVIKTTSAITDAKYAEYVGKLNATDCAFNSKACSGSHLELGITSLGWDTVVDRKSNSIEFTYYTLTGKGLTASKSEMKEVKAKYESEDYKCS